MSGDKYILSANLNFTQERTLYSPFCRWQINGLFFFAPPLHKGWIWVFILIFSLLSIQVFPQNASNSEEKEEKKQAEKCFEEKNYSKASERFSHLLSLYPTNKYYRYMFGICLLYDSEDKTSALRYLLEASEDETIVTTYPNVFYYLGRAYHYNYQFDDAKEEYINYKSLSRDLSEEELSEIEHLIEMCTYGEKLLKNVQTLTVYRKKETDKKKFFEVYDLSGSPAKILPKVELKNFEYFISKIDRKREEYPIVIMCDTLQSSVYYSSYGKHGKQGKDIYKVLKLPNGKWSEPENLGTDINTIYDEDFPYFHSDGKTLFFCSKGHNSMGGYDIFMSTYNAEENKWSEPRNLDFPINSPADDFLFMPDQRNQTAYFASNRSSKFGSVWVYKIKVPPTPMPLTIINGELKSAQTKQNILGTITVYQLETYEIVGIFRTNSTNKFGKYTLILPPGEYKFLIKPENLEAQQTVVSIPVQTPELIPIKQDIFVGKDIKVITNYKQREIDEELLSMSDFIKKQAELNENTTSLDYHTESYPSIERDSENNLKSDKIYKDSVLFDIYLKIDPTFKKGAKISDLKFPSIKFDENKSDIKNLYIEFLAYVALFMRIAPNLKLKITGYYDEISPDKTKNLTKKRIQNIIDHLKEKYLISADRFFPEITTGDENTFNNVDLLFIE